MSENVTVPAADVKAVTLALNVARALLPANATSVPGWAAGCDACDRLLAAVSSPMPQDPVSAFDQMAVLDRHTYDAYRGQGFDEDQSFHILMVLITMRCNLTLAAAHG